MARLHHVLAAGVLAVLTHATVARAEAPPAPPAAPAAPAAAMGHLMVVLDVLGVVEKGAPKTTAATLAPRTPTWLSPDPPKTPLFYSSLVVAKF